VRIEGGAPGGEVVAAVDLVQVRSARAALGRRVALVEPAYLCGMDAYRRLPAG
jgi:hypothetical protein